jgi:hypothetical protein
MLRTSCEASSYARRNITAGIPKLLQQVRDRCRALHYSLRTEDTYVHWIKRFISASWQAPPVRNQQGQFSP